MAKKQLEKQGFYIDKNALDEVYIKNEEGKLVLLTLPEEEEKQNENN